MKGLQDARLYGIIDLNYVDASEVERVASKMVEGGVDLIQLRAKNETVVAIVDLAAKLHTITREAAVPLIVNDYAEVARWVPVEGVHVGQDDDSIAIAREKAGRKIIIGKSTHSLEQARTAKDEGADYIGFGPIFATPTKPDYEPIGLGDIRKAHLDLTLPIFCIGGIKRENLEQVIAAGAKRVVIVSGLLKAKEIAAYARACKNLLVADL